MTALKLIAFDPRLRSAALGIMLMGTVGASLSPYRSLVAIQLFGFSDSALAAIIVVGGVFSVIAAVYSGIVTDQWASRRKVALITATLSGVGFLLVWITQHPAAFLLSALITTPIGFSLMGQLYAIARLAVADKAPDLREPVMSMMRAGFAIPFVVILPLWSVAFSAGMSLIQLYAAMSLSSAAILIAFYFGLPKDGAYGKIETKSGLSLRASLGELVHRRILVRLLLMATIVSANTVYLTTMSLIFESVHPEGTARTARFASMVAGLEVPFMLMLPWFTKRYSKSAILLVASLAFAVLLLVFPLIAATSAVWILALFGAMGGAAMLTLPISYFQELMENRPGAGSSLLSINQVTSQMIAGGLFWIGTSISGYSLVMIIGAATAIVASAILWGIDRRHSLL